jgi:hypothetical protein
MLILALLPFAFVLVYVFLCVREADLLNSSGKLTSQKSLYTFNSFRFKRDFNWVDDQRIAEKTRLKILPVLTREHYTSLLHWV